MSRRTVLKASALAALIPGAALAAYPDRPIRLIVPFAAGGGVDAVARLLGKVLTAQLGESVVIDNRGGGGGVIGMDAVAKAPPDGYTLLLSHSGFTAMPGLYGKLPFDPVRDFAGVITAVAGAYVLAVNPASPIHSVADLIAEAKAHPGTITYGSAGIGSTVHLATESFKRIAGVDLVHVPYKGAGPAIADLIGGQIRMVCAPAINVLPLASAGRLRALAVTSAQRSALAPELPTVAESGLPGFAVVGWYGLAAPAQTPTDVIGRLNAEVNGALAAPEFLAQLRQQGLDPIGGAPDEANARIKSDVAYWTTVIRDAGIKPQ